MRLVSTTFFANIAQSANRCRRLAAWSKSVRKSIATIRILSKCKARSMNSRARATRVERPQLDGGRIKNYLLLWRAIDPAPIVSRQERVGGTLRYPGG